MISMLDPTARANGFDRGQALLEPVPVDPQLQRAEPLLAQSER